MYALFILASIVYSALQDSDKQEKEVGEQVSQEEEAKTVYLMVYAIDKEYKAIILEDSENEVYYRWKVSPFAYNNEIYKAEQLVDFQRKEGFKYSRVKELGIKPSVLGSFGQMVPYILDGEEVEMQIIEYYKEG